MPYKPVIGSLPIVAREVKLKLAKKLWDDLGHLHQRYMLALAHTRTHTELSCVIHLSCLFAHVHLQAYEKRSSARGPPYGPPTNALVGRHLGLGQIQKSDEQPMCSHRLSSVSKSASTIRNEATLTPGGKSLPHSVAPESGTTLQRGNPVGECIR